MSYSCTDFTDTILDALRIELPEEFYDSPSDQADLALAKIEKLRRQALCASENVDPDKSGLLAASCALQHLREAYRLLKNAPRARERVRLAITSTGGAVRHARHHRDRGAS